MIYLISSSQEHAFWANPTPPSLYIINTAVPFLSSSSPLSFLTDPPPLSYNNDLEGIVVSYDKLEVLDQDAEIFFERPHLHFVIRFRALVYRPIVGSYIEATVNNISDGDHIGLLVHGLFNAVLMPSKGALPQDYAHVKDTNSWTNSTTQESITVGTNLRLKVTRVEQSAGIISMQASMLDELTGIIR